MFNISDEDFKTVELMFIEQLLLNSKNLTPEIVEIVDEEFWNLVWAYKLMFNRFTYSKSKIYIKGDI